MGHIALDPASTGVYFASLDGKENRLLLRGGAAAPLMPRDFCSTVRDTTLMAQTFRPGAGATQGGSSAGCGTGRSNCGRGFFDVSENGVLIYQAGWIGRRETIDLV